MAGLVEGAVVGVLLQELVNLVKDVKQKSSEFESISKELEETLRLISPTIEQIQGLNGTLDIPNTELQPLVNLLKEGKQLVEKCDKVTKWGIYKRTKLWSKLTGLEGKIKRYFELNMSAVSARNILKISADINDLSKKFDRLASVESCLGGSAASHTMLDSPEVPDEQVWTVGLEQPLKELKMMLFSSQEIVNVLSAPGGSGKTTLVNALRNDVDVKGRFTYICFATISKTPNVMAIIRTLLQQMHIRAPDFQSEKEAFNHLKVSLKSLEQVPVLCILDDVWSESDSLLESFEINQKGFKILVTSRSVFPRFHSTYRLELLSDADAMALFCKSAFWNGNPNFINEDLLKKIVGKCKNNPLALKVIGKALKGQSRAVWESREKNWFQSVVSEETQLLASLRASLDSLDKKVILKDCFFDLALFPEDSRIPVTALVDMWVEQYKLEDEVFAISNLHELSNRCLVDLVITRNDATELYSCYSGNFITQHDILRELAVHQSMQDPIEQRRRLIIEICGNHIPEWLLKQKCQATEARLLSISTDEEFKSNWWEMELPGVEVLLLSLHSRNYELPKFVKTMENLRALVITNHGVCHTQLSNFLVLGSLSNLRRIRLENVSIPSIFKSCSHHEPVGNVLSRMIFYVRTSLLNNYTCRDVTPMKNLKKITLVMCSIGQAFSNCSVQLSEILPELEEIHIDYCNDLVELPSQVCGLGKLKKVSITNCPKLTQLPERFGDLGATLEVLILLACTELRELPTSIGSLQNLTILDISECLSLRSLPMQMCEMENLRMLHMRGCTSLSQLPASIIDLPHLKEVYCDEETAILWEPHQESLPKLRVIILPEIVNLNWLRSSGISWR